MWRERFCLNLPPLQRFQQYLTNEEWEEVHGDNDTDYYCLSYPEFRIRAISDKMISAEKEVPIGDRWLPWLWECYGNKIMVIKYNFLHFGFLLKEVIIWWCDNGREPVPLPKLEFHNDKGFLDDGASYSWVLSRQSINYLVGNKIAQLNGINLENTIKKTKIVLVD